MKYSIATLIIAALFYFGSIVLEKKSLSLHEDAYWGRAPQSAFKTSDTMRETSEYMNKGSIVVAIAGGLWLIVTVIQQKKN